MCSNCLSPGQFGAKAKQYPSLPGATSTPTDNSSPDRRTGKSTSWSQVPSIMGGNINVPTSSDADEHDYR